MKKLSLIFACAALLFASTALRAENVDESQARNVAVAYMASVKGQKVPDFSAASLFKVYINPATGDKALYIYNISDKGYVVVSGHTATAPVLAYDDNRALTNADIEDNAAFADWLQHYADMVSVAQVEELPYSRKDAFDWATLSEGRVISRLASKGNNPKLLVKTFWAQSEPYNEKCPMYSGATRSVVGCVALALGMVLRYWEYPVSPQNESYDVMVSSVHHQVNFDTITYNYSLMPNKLNSGAAGYAQQKEEVTRFLYHCGLAVDMHYTNTGSGTNMGAVTVALGRNYKYSGYSFLERRDHQDDWVDIMRTEILSGRPVIYRASDEGSTGDHAGHCFVIAGYDTATGLFRVNWGWGDAAVWADMSDINGLHTQLGSTYYQYSAGQGAFINVMPPADSIKVELPDPSYLAINNVEEMASISDIYPQPASQQVTIPYALTGNTDEQMEIYNVEGKLMTSFRVSAANTKATVSVNGYPAGIYTCRIKGASRKFIVK